MRNIAHLVGFRTGRSSPSPSSAGPKLVRAPGMSASTGKVGRSNAENAAGIAAAIKATKLQAELNRTTAASALPEAGRGSYTATPAAIARAASKAAQAAPEPPAGSLASRILAAARKASGD